MAVSYTHLDVYKRQVVEALHKSPGGDPIAYFIRGAVIALRDEDARKVLVEDQAGLQ